MQTQITTLDINSKINIHVEISIKVGPPFIIPRCGWKISAGLELVPQSFVLITSYRVIFWRRAMNINKLRWARRTGERIGWMFQFPKPGPDEKEKFDSIFPDGDNLNKRELTEVYNQMRHVPLSLVGLILMKLTRAQSIRFERDSIWRLY